MKRWIIKLVIAAVTVAMVVGVAPDESKAEAKKRVKLGASAVATPGYVMYSGMTQILNKNSKLLEITLVETVGSKALQDQLHKGMLDIGLTIGGNLVAGYNGIIGYKQKQDNLRVLILSWPLQIFGLVSQKSGINSYDELGGKTMATPAGSGSEWHVFRFFEALDYIKPSPLKPMGSKVIGDAFLARQIDGYFKVSASDPTTLKVQEVMPIKFLPVTEEMIAKVNAKFPGMGVLTTIPAGSYKGQDKDVPTWQYTLGEGTTKDLPDDVAFEFCKVIYENRGEVAKLLKTTGPYQSMAENTLAWSPIPLHRGAVKFYRSIGLTVPEKLIPPEMN